MRGPSSAASTGRPGVNRRVSMFDLSNRNVPPSLSSPPGRASGRGLTSAASFSHGGGSAGASPRLENNMRSPTGSGTPPIHKKAQSVAVLQQPPEDPEMLDLLRNQLEALAMAKEAEV